jgi:hypothetical protein
LSIHKIEKGRRKIMKKTSVLFILFAALALLSACTTPAADVAEEVVEDVVDEEASLVVGNKSYSLSDLEAFETMDVDYTGKDGETTTYTGILISTLLEDAGLGDGKNLILVAADGFEGTAVMADVLACENCIIAFDGDTLRSVMPDMGGKANVKELIEIGVE